MRLSKIRAGWLVAGMSVIAVLVVLALSAVIIATTGGSPYGSLKAVLQGSVGSQASLSDTLLNATPLLVVAVGSCICARAGEFNIGQEGQVLIGAMAAARVCLKLNLVGPVLLVLALVVAALAGGVWASLSSLMKRIAGVNVVVSTLLMTFVAQQLVTFAVNKSWFLQEQQVGSYSTPSPESDLIPGNSVLGSLGHYPNLQLNLGLFIALGLTVIVALMLARSRWGFRLKMLGMSKAAARHAGVRVAGLSALALAITGGFAGLAGAFLVTSPVGNFRFQPGTSDNFGWDGLLVALVARNRPWACIPFALLFGILRSGGNFISATGVPSYIVDVVKALLVLAFVAPPALVSALQRRMAVVRTITPAAPVLEGAAA
ncbi:MAG: ABC transporter permease [Actinobacteria bacterium]|nr:ABC transporter permease [Actinomycetota bacterium]